MILTPLISVVIPFLNVENYLEEAIESVLAQTYSHWELILVDDGSQDGSRAIAERYCRANPDRIRCVEHHGRVNRGVSISRNLGRRYANGPFVAFLDSDDKWVPTKLETQVEILNNHPEVDIIVGSTYYWYSWLGEPDDPSRDKLLLSGGPQDQLTDPPSLAERLYPIGLERAPSMNTVLVRATAFDDVGGFEPQFIRSFEDQAFLVKFYLFRKVFISSRVCDYYRMMRPGSITINDLSGESRYKHKYLFYKWLTNYLEKSGFEGTNAFAIVSDNLSRPEYETYRHPVLSQLKHVLRFVKRYVRFRLN
jgi:glycosyltransferase involved in cell wall biosynthesis